MVVLSSLSVVAYKCVFHNGFLSSPESYFFHLFYYRSHHCIDSSINWEFLGVQQTDNITEILQMPDETHLTRKNFQMSVVQLILNCLLVVTSFSALGEVFWYLILKILTECFICSHNILAYLFCISSSFLLGTLYSILPYFSSHYCDGFYWWNIICWR